jgi:hypothetical protein
MACKRVKPTYFISHFFNMWQVLQFNFECVHPVVFELMYWIYLLPSTQQTIGYNDFIMTCFNSHERELKHVVINPVINNCLLC